MNSKLAEGAVEKFIPINDIKTMAKKNKSDMVNISGGEPTYSPQLRNLVEEIRSWGCKVGMSTNGIYHEVLRSMLGLLNYVSLDIKSPDGECYRDLGSPSGLISVLISKSLLMEEKTKRDDFDFELRTTLYPPFINKETLDDIGTLMRGDESWVLQQFRPVESFSGSGAEKITAYSHDEVQGLLKIARNYTLKACIKYV